MHGDVLRALTMALVLSGCSSSGPTEPSSERERLLSYYGKGTFGYANNECRFDPPPPKVVTGPADTLPQTFVCGDVLLGRDSVATLAATTALVGRMSATIVADYSVPYPGYLLLRVEIGHEKSALLTALQDSHTRYAELNIQIPIGM